MQYIIMFKYFISIKIISMKCFKLHSTYDKLKENYTPVKTNKMKMKKIDKI